MSRSGDAVVASRAVSSSPSRLRSTAATWAPRASRASTTSRPMPLPPPVTTKTLSLICTGIAPSAAGFGRASRPRDQAMPGPVARRPRWWSDETPAPPGAVAAGTMGRWTCSWGRPAGPTTAGPDPSTRREWPGGGGSSTTRAACPTVELNASHYRWPRDTAFRGWRERLPAGFEMAVKAPRALTHARQLRDPSAGSRSSSRGMALLGDRAGPLLLQLPPGMERDEGRLDHVLARMPSTIRVAVEFRHASWLDEQVFGVLERHGAAYVVMSGAHLPCVLRATADLVYVRWHGPDAEHLYAGSYSEDDLRWWADRLREWQGGGSPRARLLQQRPVRVRGAQRAAARRAPALLRRRRLASAVPASPRMSPCSPRAGVSASRPEEHNRNRVPWPSPPPRHSRRHGDDTCEEQP